MKSNGMNIVPTLFRRSNLLTFILLFLTAMGTAGCAIHNSGLNTIRLEVPASYSTREFTPAPPSGKWWEQFNDTALNELIEQTLLQNLDIEKAYARLLQSQAAVRIAGASSGLKLNIEGFGGRAQKPGQVTGETYGLSAAAGYEIDLWGKLKSGTEAARLDALASEADLKALYISISAQTAELYYLAVEQQAQIELIDETITTLRDTLDRVEFRYREGLAPAIDVYQSRQNLAAALGQKPLFESRLASTLNAISVLAGVFPEGTLDVNKGTLAEGPEFPAGLPSQLLTRRPDVHAALLRMQSSDARVAAAVADRFPSFNLIGTYGGSGNRISTVLDSPNIFWNILLQAAQPVLDAGRRSAEVDRSSAVFKEKLADYHKTVLNAFREVEDAVIQRQTARQRLTILQERLSLSENELRLALDNYLQGLSDYLPVLTAQERFYTTQSSLLTARRQMISDNVQLARALGGEWVEEIDILHLEKR